MKCVIQTFTGREVNPLDLRAEDIHIYDIAHALALVNRFAGHTKFPISVAQHCVYASRLCEGTGAELQALLHDASEAYLSDVTKWLKATPEFAGYREAEDRAQALIFQVFGCATELHPAVETADRLLVRFEGVQGFGVDFRIDHPDYPALTFREIMSVGRWIPWTWKNAEQAFLGRFIALQKARV